ncbi:response regulator transcription factor [Aminobacter anthyllidis]|uniref:response regulator transcription factor n=1 Tax=Aminobacter anthyllidis TaxID=1035067 RepID=UPI0024564A97|nr:response regulator transcription factor [Aminobacter anthyllidis]MDH4984360.1 response regulator transcription factor [Aminobacter anthyllidis]
MTTDSPLRIVIADDHALVRGGIGLLFKMIDHEVQIIECNSYENVLDTLEREDSVDLLLLDLLMPGMELTKSVQNICERWPEVPLVLISVREDAQTIRNCFRLGISGYIPKTSSPEITLNAFRLVLSGGIYVPPGALQLGLGNLGDAVSPPGSDASASAANIGLTARQMDVMNLVVQGKSNVEIANDLNLAPGTVKMHLARIYKVLKVRSRTEAAAKMRKAEQMR